MSQFFSSISEVAKNYKGYDDWEQEQDNVLARKQYLIKEKPLDKFEKEALEKKAASIVRVSEIMDTRSEDNAQDVEFLTQTAAGIGVAGGNILAQFGLMKYFDKKFQNATKETLKNWQKRFAISQIGTLAFTLLLSAGFILWGNSKTKEASRLGRFQAKKHELKDEKSFVQFTPEQIAKAEKIAASMPDEKQKTGLLRAIKNVKQMLVDGKDYKAYKASKKHSKHSGIPSQKLTKAQREQAEKDKELLLNVIKKINNTAEDYSENVENAFDTITATSFLATIPIGFGLNKLFTKLKLNIPKTKVAAGISMIFPILVSIWSLNAEKKAARVGRYMAKKEILENPELLRKFSDEDMKSVENISAPKRNNGFFKKIGDNFKFIGKYLKDSISYDKYIKKERPKHEKLNKALLQVDVSEEQLKEARHIQEKTFMSFDKIDEMSQRYSEDMEAAGEIGKNVVSTGFSLLGVGAMVGGLFLFIKGKIPMHKIIKFISKVTFKKSSPIRQTTEEFYGIINKNKELKRAFNKILSPAGGKSEAINKLIENPEIKSAFVKMLKGNNLAKPATELLDTISNDYYLRSAFYKLLLPSADKEAALASIITNPKIAKIVTENPSVISIITQNPMELAAKFKNSIIQSLPKQLNDNAFAKWGRNLIAEIGALKVNSNAPWNMKKEVKEITDKVLSKVTDRKITNNYSRYKTLINTSAIAAIPVLGVIVGIPFAICSWLTNMQKKAGRIGVMKAIKDLDNASLYVNNNLPAQNNTEVVKSQETNPGTQGRQKEIFEKFLKQNNNVA